APALVIAHCPGGAGMAYREFCAKRLLEVQRSLEMVERDVRSKRVTIVLLESLACFKAAGRVRCLLGDMEIALTSLEVEREQLTRYLLRLGQSPDGLQEQPIADNMEAAVIVTGLFRPQL